MTKKATINLELQQYIDAPVSTQQLYQQSCQNDQSTIANWRKTWLKQIKANKEKFGSFCENSIGKFHNAFGGKPAILVGSGPSLVKNGHELARAKNCVVISCLHNFHFCLDKGIPVDFYVTLDAGKITIDEVSEGGVHPPEYYWEQTKGKTLFAYIGSSPELLEKWQGKIYFFNCPLPDKSLWKEINEIEPFYTMVSTGGNVLGASLYIAKGILGCFCTAFVGADFCFSYDNKFHGWDSSYDEKMGQVIRSVDIYGIPVKTWPSYHSFKGWFECQAIKTPGVYFNCSEGGSLGAYLGGNIRNIIQYPLKDFLTMINMQDHLEKQCKQPDKEDPIVLF